MLVLQIFSWLLLAGDVWVAGPLLWNIMAKRYQQLLATLSRKQVKEEQYPLVSTRK